ncbi:MAG: hypothetical protein IPM76_20610 [Chloroflexi bacterium]|nr:hypothetical protein [Chloroflexota bacterium]
MNNGVGLVVEMNPVARPAAADHEYIDEVARNAGRGAGAFGIIWTQEATLDWPHR